ncbi:hypothetical protein [Kordia zhangzhouensis]|uniref:hypothetical protein n=1 Tax=Kordia zhangzhouensis TaxID=1620405 RepID=UPI0006294283|nr:hypothetical protein [Kordia zhangzhouensis]
MKKKNVQLGKLKLNKSSIASFDRAKQIVGGSNVGPGCNSDIECTLTCAQDTCTSVPQPSPSDNCNTQFPQCQATDVACGSAYNPTQCNCGSSPGDFLCEAVTFGGAF